jgi:hypothetical protein
MFFRKRIRVPDFLEGRFRDLINQNGILILESFFDEYREMRLKHGYQKPLSEGDTPDSQSAERELFINRFIGTYLWLIKYRTLGNLFNSPRKLAYLDLTFDTATPDIVDKTFYHYDAAIIKETYDIMDIGCKKAYTGDLQKNDKPRFLISPLWARDVSPHPFRVAAQLFIQIAEYGPPPGSQEETAPAPFIDALVERFMEMTQKAAEVAKGLNIT